MCICGMLPPPPPRVKFLQVIVYLLLINILKNCVSVIFLSILFKPTKHRS